MMNVNRWKFHLLLFSISFLNIALAGWAFPGTVNPLILRAIYGHLTRR